MSMNSCCDFNFTSSKIEILGMEITFDVIFIFRFAIALIRNGVENEWIQKKILIHKLQKLELKSIEQQKLASIAK